ncbi:ABC transporter substrate-binding protein [Clostridia bacterium]|nr:ABC transporter substrate-binding protein [Clostridia bacterium]
MKKLVSLVLTLSMLFTLALCTGVPAMAQETPEPITFTIFIDHSWYPVETFTGIIPEEITRLTGVTLDPTIAIDAEQLGVMIATGELPDLVYTQNMIDRMSDADVSYSYEDLIAEYGIDWNISEKQLGIGRGFSTDGKAYSILNHYSEKADWADVTGAAPMVGSLILRGDLLDALGNPSLGSFDDLFSVFGQVKAAYPDVVPLKLNTDWNVLTFRYLQGMGGLDFIEQPDGSYVHYSETETYKDILLWLNECYRAGYIESDDPYFVRGSTAIAQDKFFANANCTQNTLPGINGDLWQVDSSFYAIEMPPFEVSNYSTSNLGWSATMITKSCKDPKRALEFIAWMFSPEAQKLTQMGREGIDYTVNEAGLPVFSEDWVAAIDAGSSMHNKIYNPWFYLGGSDVVEAITRCATTDQKYVGEAYAIMSERFDNLPWINAGQPVGDIDEKVILDKIKELSASYDKRIILADTAEAAQALYDEYLSNAGRTGISTLDEYVSGKITEVMPLYQ